MSYDDLPADWPSRSLGDPTFAADLVDLVVRDADRRSGAFVLLLCDGAGRMAQPVLVEDVPRDADVDERRAFFDVFLDASLPGVEGLVLVVTRPWGSAPDDLDRAWHQSAIDACRSGGLALWGTYLATGDGVTVLPDHLRSQVA